MVSAQYFRRLPYTSTRGLPKPLQDCRFSLRSKCHLEQDCRLHFISPTSLYFYEGFTQTLTTKYYAFSWFFICVRVCEQAHTASTNKNPVTFVTGFVPRTGIEPALPCDNQILSLARLPVPPSGPLY